MAQSSSAAHPVAARYATALLETAEQAGALDSVAKDIADLLAMVNGSDDLGKLLASPAFGREQGQAVMKEISSKAGLNKLTANFLQVLSVNGRLNVLKAALSAFQNEMAKRSGQVTAQVKSAFPLSNEQQEALKKSLGKNVSLDLSVDRSLLGGMVVTIGSRMIDDSVKSKLERLKQNLQTSNQNQSNLKEVG